MSRGLKQGKESLKKLSNCSIGACVLPRVSGPCEGYYPLWYYDKERKGCAQFVYGGCLGNANRFETREDCENTCSTDTDPVG